MKRVLLTAFLISCFSLSMLAQFTLPVIPTELKQPAARADYLVRHYWDKFDAGNTALLANRAVTEQAFVDFITLLPMVSMQTVDAGSKALMERLNHAPLMLQYLLSLAEEYLYAVASPYTNDIYLVALLQAAPLHQLSEVEASHWRYLLNVASKNHPGHLATDFNWVASDGKRQSLFEVRAKHLVLFFYDAECEECMLTLPQLAEVTWPKDWQVVCIDTHNNLSAWQRIQPDIPTHWISGYDAGMQVLRRQLYDLKRLPTLYLLDADKRVVLKDTDLPTLLKQQGVQ